MLLSTLGVLVELKKSKSWLHCRFCRSAGVPCCSVPPRAPCSRHKNGFILVDLKWALCLQIVCNWIFCVSGPIIIVFWDKRLHTGPICQHKTWMIMNLTHFATTLCGNTLQPCFITNKFQNQMTRKKFYYESRLINVMI